VAESAEKAGKAAPGQGARTAWGDALPDREEQREFKRQVVLKTAARAFVENGFHKTSLASIAAELNINKATLYHYFRSKDEILYECHREAINSIIGDAERDWRHERGAREELETFIRRYVGMITGVFGMTLVVIRTNQLEPESRERCREGRRRIDHLLREIIQLGMADGSFRTCEPTTTTAFVFGSLNWICHWYHPDGEMSLEQLTTEAIDFVAHALSSGHTQNEPGSGPLKH
jgi:AcrR family transcriptional regulator